ncbi:hypothetical protein HDU84_006533, partial [Entophlyctis sp. JEL0112]
MSTTLLVILQLGLLAIVQGKTTCTTVSTSLPVASSYCQTTDAVCTMFEDPEVIPFEGYPFQYTSTGSVYILKTEEFEVVATLEKGKDFWGTQYLVIASATATCADGRTVTYVPSQLSSTATVFSCAVGDCSGDKCSVTFLQGTNPIANVDVKSVVYKGTHGLGGLCYKNDPACPTTNLVVPTATTALAPVPTSPVYCDPSSNYCSITDDPVVHTFSGTSIKFNSVGTFYAFKSLEMQVVVTITSAKNWFGQTVSVVTSATASCADGVSVTYTPKQLSYQLNVFTCVYGNDCTGKRCTVSFSKGTDPVDNVAINPITYLGGRALGGLCFEGNPTCPTTDVVFASGTSATSAKTTATQTSKATLTTTTAGGYAAPPAAQPTTTTLTSTADVYAPPPAATSASVNAKYCQTTDQVCTAFDDPEIIPFEGYPFYYTTPGSAYLIDTAEFQVEITLGNVKGPAGTELVIISATANCADGRSVSHTFSQLSSVPSVFSCGVGDCTGDKCSVSFVAGRVSNVNVQSLIYKGTHGFGGLCYKNDAMCPLTNVVLPTVTSALPSVPTTPVYCDPSSNYCSITDDPVVHTFSGTSIKFNSVGTFYAFKSLEMQVVVTITSAKNWFGQTVSVVTSATASCADGTSVTYTPKQLSYQLNVFTCVYGNDCTGKRCTVSFSKGTDPVDNVAINPITYLGGRALGGLCFEGNPTCPT